MRALWRISRHCDLEGLGGERASGRWHTAARGKRVIYLSEHPALALIEVLANLKADPRLLPDYYQLLKVSVADGVSTKILLPELFSEHWREDMRETQAAGDAWLAEGKAALLTVPSAPSPESVNYLLNPRHREARGVTVEWCRRVEYDKRLFGVSASTQSA